MASWETVNQCWMQPSLSMTTYAPRFWKDGTVSLHSGCILLLRRGPETLRFPTVLDPAVLVKQEFNPSLKFKLHGRPVRSHWELFCLHTATPSCCTPTPDSPREKALQGSARYVFVFVKNFLRVQGVIISQWENRSAAKWIPFEWCRLKKSISEGATKCVFDCPYRRKFIYCNSLISQTWNNPVDSNQWFIWHP